MLSVASLLNPVKPEPRGTRLPSSPLSSLCTSSRGSPQLPNQSSTKKQKMSKDGPVFVKGKIKGEVNFPPFQNLGREAMEEVEKFQVYPFGTIDEYCRHIPYNSEKKNFLEKTGRESFEVFQYTFKIPGDEKAYMVMWDYNIGLVRITPFFKCCKYSKTMPAKMLSMNPGLKEITHSITGGSLAAQGYWMPFGCALAVCATFCADIAGALIPIFGPDFPSQCVPPEAPEWKRMTIDPAIVVQATEEAERYRMHYSMQSPKSSRSSYSPQQRVYEPSLSMRSTPSNNLERRLRLKRPFGGDSPYGTTTDTDIDGNASETSSGDGYYCSPVTPVSVNSHSLHHSQTWQSLNTTSHLANSSVNLQSHRLVPGSNPLLSAIPRSTGLIDVHMSNSWTAIKRRADDADDEYEAESPSVADEKVSDAGKSPDKEMEDAGRNGSAPGGVEQNAAMLLMNLNMKDGEYASNLAAKVDSMVSDGPRVKRRRATSM
ncbi:hypothetical protein HYALB_00001424 [Hymenoscyphus albidus]|uniref:HTH APSES-type domain-containing protein n=1 Tax=Hymenoscyphus albidus TaxID=595503 RepID=A0A9N9LBT4_9HELO|nr:hypothetical protein HYALB_00001424 [Hymenoscyphus albidus]